MKFLLFEIGKDRYAVAASEVREVLPLVQVKTLLQAPPGVAGIFNYRGTPVPVIDVNEMAVGTPAKRRLSTRIILVDYDAPGGQRQPVGLLAERVTQIIDRNPEDFLDPGVSVEAAPYMGAVTRHGQELIQRIELVRLLSDKVQKLLFHQPMPQLE